MSKVSNLLSVTTSREPGGSLRFVTSLTILTGTWRDSLEDPPLPPVSLAPSEGPNSSILTLRPLRSCRSYESRLIVFPLLSCLLSYDVRVPWSLMVSQVESPRRNIPSCVRTLLWKVPGLSSSTLLRTTSASRSLSNIRTVGLIFIVTLRVPWPILQVK